MDAAGVASDARLAPASLKTSGVTTPAMRAEAAKSGADADVALPSASGIIDPETAEKLLTAVYGEAQMAAETEARHRTTLRWLLGKYENANAAAAKDRLALAALQIKMDAAESRLRQLRGGRPAG